MKTECPHCHTIFNVSQAQLQAADGMVRCGMCQQVFNALVQPDLFDADESSTADSANTQTAIEATGNEQPVFESDETATAPDVDSAVDSTGIDAVTGNSTHDNILFDSSEPASLVPDELRHGSGRRSVAVTLAYSIGSLLLLATLVLQYAWLQREQLLTQAWLQPWLQQACERFDCSVLQLRDPSQIELSSRNVYTHPNEKNALMVSLTLVNTAPYAQPYPAIQIEFSDVVGNVIAARRLQPSEYLNADTDNLQALQPDSPVTLALEIVDPGKQALTYEFKFL